MKIELNFIYLPHKNNPSKKIYEDDSGIIWMSSKKDPNKFNIALGSTANINPSGKDSILVLEPICVSPSDYNYNNLNMYYKVFAWCEPAMKNVKSNKVVTINHPSWTDPPSFESLIRPPWEERSGIVIISNNKKSNHISNIYDLRIKLADYLYTQGHDISWYGQIPIDKPYFKGPTKDKMEVMRKAKFCICPENCYHAIYSWGYFSEKMTDAWFGGAVPIYMGCYNINNLQIPQTYIDLRSIVNKQDYSLNINFSKLDEILKNYSKENHEFMLTKTAEFMKSPTGIYNEISRSRAYSKIIQTFL